MEHGSSVVVLRRHNRVFRLFSIVAVIVLLAAGVPVAGAQPDRLDVIISFDSPPGPAEEALVRGIGGTVKGSYSIVPAMAASIPASAIEGLQRNPRVALIEPDIEVQAADLGDSDSAEVTNAWGVDRLDANLVWSTSNGSGVGVAIVDSGSGPHIDLPAATLRQNCLSGSCVSGGNDDNGHGTHVAGSVLATEDGSGVVGMAPGASLFSYKVLRSDGKGSYSAIIAALDQIVSYNAGNGTPEIRVANFSLGSSRDPGVAVRSAFDRAYASGVLIVAAAGNAGNKGGNNDTVSYPGRYASALAVGATDKSDVRASWSSTGPDVELAAPGVGIRSTWLNNGYNSISGTSMATPHVTGAAALVFAAGVVSDDNGANGIADEVRARLDSSALNLGAAGRDNLYGYGLVNPPAAVGVGNTHF